MNDNVNVDFVNEKVELDRLPYIDKEEFTPIEKKYKRLLNIRILLIFHAIIIPFGLLFRLGIIEMPTNIFLIISIALSVWLSVNLILIHLSFPIRGYLIRNHDISYKKGLLSFRQVSIPYNRIQHVAIRQGMLEKAMKLASVKIFTAGGSSSDLIISGLKPEDAEQIKEFLSDKISNNE